MKKTDSKDLPNLPKSHTILQKAESQLEWQSFKFQGSVVNEVMIPAHLVHPKPFPKSTGLKQVLS